MMNKNIRGTCWPVFCWLGGIDFLENLLINGFDEEHLQVYLQA